MIRLLRTVHFPYWRRSPLAVALPVLGVALGVAAIVGIDLGSRSTVSGVRSTFERLEGRATHQVVPAGGRLDPALAWELRESGAVEAAAPILETIALAEEPLRLIGLDAFAEAGIRQLGLTESTTEGSDRGVLLRFLAEPGALVVSAPFLDRHDLEVGDEVVLRVGAYRRVGTILAALPRQVDGVDVPDNIALCDLAMAQEFLDRDDATRLDLVVPTENRTANLDRIRSLLPDGVRLARPGGRAAYVEGMLTALQTNLQALSYLALFVSLFLIYNAMLIAVLRRRPQIGLVRCLGATRREVLGAWLCEGLALGLLGTAAGLLLGTLGGRFTLGAFAQTAQDLYGAVHGSSLTLPAITYWKASIVGILASLLTAAFPAAEAASTPPAHTAYRGEVEGQARARSRRAPWFALPFGAVFLASVVWPSTDPALGYVAAVSLAICLALVTPALGDLVLAGLRPLLARVGGVIAGLAAENIRASLSRTGVALAALTVALSMSIAMGTMVSSFRTEMVDWIGQVIRADIYLSPATAEVDRVGARLPAELVDRLRNRPGVGFVDTYRGVEARVDGFDTFLAGVESDEHDRRTEPRIVEGPTAAILIDRMEAGQAAITEALMRRAGIHSGDEITVEADGQRFKLRVAGVYRDYASDRGTILVFRERFEELLGARDPNSVALYLEPGIDPDAEVEALKAELSRDYALLIRGERGLREQAVVVFDRTFAVANGLQGIGIAVASIGILAALLAILLERRRELATLRALGLRHDQIGRLLVIESGLLATLAWVFALAGGGTLAWVLLRIINVRSFGWSLPIEIPFAGLAVHLGLAWVAALLATVVPWVVSRRMSIAAGLREE